MKGECVSHGYCGQARLSKLRKLNVKIHHGHQGCGLGFVLTKWKSLDPLDF